LLWLPTTDARMPSARRRVSSRSDSSTDRSCNGRFGGLRVGRWAAASICRTDQPWRTADSASIRWREESSILAKARPWPAVSVPRRTMSCTGSGKFSRRSRLATAGRLRPMRWETLSWVSPHSSISRWTAEASSNGLRFSRCMFSTSATSICLTRS